MPRKPKYINPDQTVEDFYGVYLEQEGNKDWRILGNAGWFCR